MRVEEGLSPIDTRTAGGAIWSPKALAFLAGDIVPTTGTPWHLLASFAAATFAQRFKDKPFAGRGKLGPRLDDKGKVLVAAKQRQA